MKILNTIPIQELLNKTTPELAKDFVLATFENSSHKTPYDLLIHSDYLKEQEKYGFGSQTMFLIKKEGIELLKERGRFLPFLDTHFDAINGKKSWRDGLSSSVKTDLNNPAYEWVIANNKGLFNYLRNATTKEYIPEPIFLCGNPARLDDSQYDLDTLAEKLSTRKGIAFLTYQSRWAQEKSGVLFAPLKGDEVGIGGIISDIEHHLEEGDSLPIEKEELNIIFYPTFAELETIIQFINDFENNPEMRTNMVKKEKIMNHEQFIVRKILGGDEFFKHPYQEEAIPKRKFKS